MTKFEGISAVKAEQKKQSFGKNKTRYEERVKNGGESC